MNDKNSFIVGIISDTHGRLPDAAVIALAGSKLIIHAGDIGEPAILEKLKTIAPVFPVKGNMDKGVWAREIPYSEIVNEGAVFLYILHDVSRIDLDPAASGFSAVIFGHTHRPSIERQNGVFFINPGSATNPRSNYLPSVALLKVTGRVLEPQLVTL
ncbi:MAG: metallophosphoesterase [Pseudomonadota bacterium]|nr:metallophosphoesterase [Pseudomonadota bacterium]MBU1397346.1 metallophosphoesterase [Pseudomonadota bacterium]MBU1570131.1 metallophosphoesterase [Pseudomonadota bacterium]